MKSLNDPRAKENGRLLYRRQTDRLGWACAPIGVPGTPYLVRREPCEVLVFSGCNSHPATGSLQPVAIGATVEVTKPSEPSRQTGRFGDSASRQAVIASER